MNQRKGWVILAIGVGIFLVACIGVSIAAHLYGVAIGERIVRYVP